MAISPDQPLTAKQHAFVEEYLVDLNSAAAARRAGYSEANAAQIGHENMKKPHIVAAIQKAMDARSERTQVTADRVLLELARIGFADIRQLMKWDEEGVRFRPSDQLTEDEAAAISSVKSKKRRIIREDGTVEERVELELKTYDKLPALEKLGKHLKLFDDRLTISVVHRLQQLPPDELQRLESLPDEELVAELEKLSGREVARIGPGSD